MRATGRPTGGTLLSLFGKDDCGSLNDPTAPHYNSRMLPLVSNHTTSKSLMDFFHVRRTCGSSPTHLTCLTHSSVCEDRVRSGAAIRRSSVGLVTLFCCPR